VTIHLRGLPGSVERATHSLLGLAPEGVCQATQIALCAGALLPHRFSLACGRLPDPSAVCSLLHYPLGRPNLALASILPCGVPTFLDPVDAEPRPPVQLPVSGESTTVERRPRSGGRSSTTAVNRSWLAAIRGRVRPKIQQDMYS